MRISESHRRPAVQHRWFVLLEIKSDRGPYCPIFVIFRANIKPSSIVVSARKLEAYALSTVDTVNSAGAIQKVENPGRVAA